MVDYDWQCPDCKTKWNTTSTGTLDYDDELECGKCGRISKVKWFKIRVMKIEQTNKKVSPSQMEELEIWRNEKKQVLI